MERLPLGWRTDLDILRMSGSRIVDHGDVVVVATPDNPQFHWGNFMYVADPGLAADPAHCLRLYRRLLPTAAHLAIGLPGRPRAGDWAGVEVECDDVLASSRPPAARPLPDGYRVRVLESSRDWEQHVANDVCEHRRTGGADPGYEVFATARAAAQRGLAEQAQAVFVGVFADGRLVADLGIVMCGELARYQSVGTVFDHRRRGLASHLLGVAGRWAGRHGATRWVIAAERGGPARRLYEAVGMSPVDESWQVYRAAQVAAS